MQVELQRKNTQITQYLESYPYCSTNKQYIAGLQNIKSVTKEDVHMDSPFQGKARDNTSTVQRTKVKKSLRMGF